MVFESSSTSSWFEKTGLEVAESKPAWFKSFTLFSTWLYATDLIRSRSLHATCKSKISCANLERTHKVSQIEFEEFPIYF